MSLLALLSICAAGCLLGVVTAGRQRLGRAVGLAFLAAALIASLELRPGDTVTSAEIRLAVTWYAGLLITVGLTGCLALCLLASPQRMPRLLPAAALATFGLLAIALSAVDPGTALAAGAAAALPGLAIVASERGANPISTSELRTLALLAAGAALAAIWAEGASWTENAANVAPLAAYLLLALALAIRSGAVPFHVPAARLSRDRSVFELALLLVWIPAGFGALALSWTDAAATAGASLGLAATVVIAIAVATMLLGAVGALLHRELAEVALYSIAQDAGFVLLALGAHDPSASDDARLWLLAFLIGKTALLCWVAAMDRAFGSATLSELKGWARRSPLLAVALLAVAIAAVGWPGRAVFIARESLVSHALADPFRLVGLLALVLSVIVYGRLLLVGAMAPSERVVNARGDLLRLPLPGPVRAWPARLRRLGRPRLGGRAGPERALRAAISTARANGTPARHLLVLATAIVAVAIALGGFGAGRASSSDWALQAAVTPAPSPLPSQTSGETPGNGPEGAQPGPSDSGDGSPLGAPSDSPAPSGSLPGPSGSAQP